MKQKIYYHDTDAGGVVYYANYLKFLEEARTEFLEQQGLSVKDFHDRGVLYAVRKCIIDYKSPARYGETIVASAKLIKVTAAQMVFEQTVCENKTNRLLVTAEVHLVCLNKDFKPIQIPEELREQLG